MKYEKQADQIIEYLGGKENITGLVHCATRLRFQLKDSGKADKVKIEAMNEVLSVVQSGGQYQVVIGSQVADYYEVIMKKLKLKTAQTKERGEKTNPVSKVFEIISGAFSPLIPALAGAGMIIALLTVLTTIGVMSDESSTYAILNAAGYAVFYFLPVFLGITLSIKAGGNPYVGGVIGAALLDPNFTALIGSEGAVTFLGIPVTPIDYASSVFPIFVAILIYCVIDRGLVKIIPKALQLFLVPMLSLLIMVPLTVILFGPVGTVFGNVISEAVMWIIDKSQILAGIVLGAGMPFMVVLGLHWGFTPITLQNLAISGGDPIEGAAVAAVFAEIGIAIGLFLKAKKHSKLKSLGLSTAITGLFAGVTEPIVYGIILRYKRLIPIVAISGGIGGAICGAFGVTCNAYVFHNIFSMPVYTPFIGYILGIGSALIAGAVLTYFFGFDKGELDEEDEEEPQAEPVKDETKLEEIKAPAAGRIVPLEEVEDEVFASGAVGKGLAIIPDGNQILSPVNGTVTAVFPTKHAIGITSDTGVQLLIHVGLNTVALNGKYYQTHVENGDRVKTGDLLLSFEKEQILAENYSLVTPVLIANTDQMADIIIVAEGQVQQQETLMKVINI